MSTPPPSLCSGPNGCDPHVKVPLYQSLIFLVPIVFTLAVCLLLFVMYVRSRHYFLHHPDAAGVRRLLANAERGIGPGLSEDTIQLFPSMTFGPLLESPLANKLGDDRQCPVCLADYQEADTMRMLPCHAFHQDCIDAWLLRNPTCPVCRLNYLTIEEDGRMPTGTPADDQGEPAGESSTIEVATESQIPQPLSPERPAAARATGTQ